MAAISKIIQDALNEQIKNELYSAYLYLSMSAHCESMGLPGAAHWLRLQWEEEISHAMKLYEYIHDRGGQVVLAAINQPPSEFGKLRALFEKVLEHEQKVTSMIYKLCDLAAKEKDHATQALLQWFVTEQVEEEKNASDIIATLELLGDKGGSLVMFDRQLGKRSGD